MKRLITVASVFFLLAGCSWGQNNDSEDPVKKNPVQDLVKKEQTNKKVEQTIEENPDLLLEAEFFNEIKEVKGQNYIENPKNILSLVNKDFSLGSYKPDDLVRPKVAFSFGNQDIEKSYMRKEAANALEQMFSAAKKDGIMLFASSGYRSYTRQKSILEAEIARVGKEKAVNAVATPGQSEHQTGLAMDITSEGEGYLLTEKFGEEKEGTWLRDHANEFGFILRYPKGKERNTGYEYEPWHFRYVGKKASSVIYKNKWTLEEYFQHVKKI